MMPHLDFYTHTPRCEIMQFTECMYNVIAINNKNYKYIEF